MELDEKRRVLFKRFKPGEISKRTPLQKLSRVEDVLVAFARHQLPGVGRKLLDPRTDLLVVNETDVQAVVLGHVVELVRVNMPARAAIDRRFPLTDGVGQSFFYLPVFVR